MHRIAIFIAVSLSGAMSMACDTPVYRYAMYRWQPAPYELYYFYDSDAADDRAAAHDVIRELPYGERSGNLAILEIDLRDEQSLKRLPSAIHEQWKASKQEAPGYLVYSPQGAKLWAGDLSVKDLQALVNSPARDELTTQLGAGKVGVLLMLSASEAGEGEEVDAAKAANLKAQQAIEATIKKVGDGELNLMATEGAVPSDESLDPAAKKEIAEKAKESAGQPSLGWVRVNRDDPSERWLVRSLLAVEPDLHEEQFVRQPMVFVIYGRARALPPFVGKGIRADNLFGDVQFISGACSCTVKDQNPGVDLLTQYKWEVASELLAAKFGSEEGNETQLGVGDLFPSLAIPPSTTTDPGATEPSGTEAPNEPNEPSEPKQDNLVKGDAKQTNTSDPEDARPTSPPAKDESDPSVDSKGDGATDTGELARVDDPASATPTQARVADTTRDSLLLVGGGTVLSLLFLLGITFLVLRSS